MLKAILRTVLLILVAAIIGINIYSINAARLAGNVVPMPFGVGAAVVLSGSMEDELSVGDLVIIVERDSYAEREIVVFQEGSMAITHRIVSISDEEVITKGDANNTEDDPISLSQIKGEVVFAIPLIGYLINIIKTPIATLIIIGAAFWLLERSFRKEKEEKDQKLDEIRAEIERLKRSN